MACINYKNARYCFTDDAVFRGLETPPHYSKKYTIVETRYGAPAYKPRIKADSDVACFLKVADPATKSISPATYNAMNSFRTTQTKNI
jgi:hypothetical protein